MDKTTTWWWDKGLVDWDYRALGPAELSKAQLGAPEFRKGWLSSLFTRLPALLGDFAYPTDVEVVTLSQGDDAFRADLREKGAGDALQSFINRTDDVLYVRIELTLRCVDQDSKPIELDRGATLWIHIDLTEAGILNPTSSAPFRVTFQLHVDIYAPLTYGWVRENDVLAARNGPRLGAFLERLERDVPAELIEIDAPNYRGMIGPRGFHAPVHRPPGEKP